MSHYDLIITGGTVATADWVRACDIAVRDGKIAAIGTDLGSAERIIDASGRIVVPGGIDSHVHISQPSGEGIVMADDFSSATRSAICGGTTTVLPFALQQRGESLREVVQAYHQLADGNCHADVSFHLIVTDPTPQVLGQDLPALVADAHMGALEGSIGAFQRRVLIPEDWAPRARRLLTEAGLGAELRDA